MFVRRRRITTKTKRIVSIIQVLVLALFLTSLSKPIGTIAQTRSDPTINNLLSAYEDALSSSTAIPEQKLSPAVITLLQERQIYYKEYFELGLHSELVNIESYFDRESILPKVNGEFSVIAQEFFCKFGQEIPLVS